MEDKYEDVVPDWAALPTDLLNGVFNKLFESHTKHDSLYDWFIVRVEEWPLKVATTQLSTLRLVCKHWAKTLAQKPPEIKLELERGDEYRYAKCIAAFDVKKLMLLEFPFELCFTDDKKADSNSANRAFSYTRVLVDCLSSTKEFDMRIGQLSNLESLTIECQRDQDESYPASDIFNADPIQSLQHLSHLRLIDFEDFEIKNLPLSVRDLTLGFGIRYDDALHYSLFPELPENLCLDKLRIIGECPVGILLHEVWDRCTIVEIYARGVCLGVPMSNPDIIRRFECRAERSVAEEMNEPVDREIEWAANDAMVCTFDKMLTGIASSLQLKVLKLSGETEGMRYVPGDFYGRNKLDARTHFKCLLAMAYDYHLRLYGLESDVMLDRLLALQESGKLPPSALEFRLPDQDDSSVEGDEEDEYEEEEEEEIEDRYRIRAEYVYSREPGPAQILVKNRLKR